MRFEYILYFGTTILTSFLLFNEFSTFLVVKPTQTSLEQISLKKEYVPVMIVCPEPAFNLSALRDEGYETPYRFQNGNSPWNSDRKSSKKINVTFWSGKKNISQSMLLGKVANAFSTSDWISVGWVEFEKETGVLSRVI